MKAVKQHGTLGAEPELPAAQLQNTAAQLPVPALAAVMEPHAKGIVHTGNEYQNASPSFWDYPITWGRILQENLSSVPCSGEHRD